MKVILGFLILCGTYSIHSASLNVLQSSPCDGQVDRLVLPVHGDCSQFYLCLNGQDSLLSCGVDIHFDPVTKTCIEASKSTCVNGVRLDTPKSKPENPVAQKSICSGKAFGAFVPSKTSCSEYYVCMGINPMLKKCPVGFHFFSETRSCIEEELSKCVIKAKETDEVQKKKNPKPSLTTILTERVCLGQSNGDMFPIPGSCSKYFSCLRNRAYEKTCGPRHFDPSRKACIEPESSRCVEGEVLNNLDVVIEALKEAPKGIAYTENGLVNETNLKEYKDIANENNIKDIVPHGDRSEKNIKSLESKNSGSSNVDLSNHGDIEPEEVVEPEEAYIEPEEANVEPEKDPIVEENTELIIAVIDEKSADACVGIRSGTLLPKVGSCQEFITCESGVAYIGKCPRGLYFNPSAKFCDWPEKAGCA